MGLKYACNAQRNLKNTKLNIKDTEKFIVNT